MLATFKLFTLFTLHHLYKAKDAFAIMFIVFIFTPDAVTLFPKKTKFLFLDFFLIRIENLWQFTIILPISLGSVKLTVCDTKHTFQN